MTGDPVAAPIQRASVLLAELARELGHLEASPSDHLSGLICQLAALQNVLAAQLVSTLQDSSDAARGDGDRLLTVAQAAERLACSADWLYRHRLPFAVRNGRQLRFSAHGLERYIRHRAGRDRPSLPSDTER
jgi:hypothetical protein